MSSLIALSACAKEEESIIVLNAVAPTADESASCMISASDTPFGEGLVDLSFDTGYTLGLNVRNNLAAVKNSNTGIDDSEMFIESADVRLDIPQDPGLIDNISSGDSSLIEFNQVLANTSLSSQDEVGVAVDVPRASLEAIGNAVGSSHGTGPDTRVTMTVSVVLHAIRAANTLPGGVGDVEAREFTFPVEICFNCLRDCSACAPDSGVCTGTNVGSGICGNAQDSGAQPLDCTGV
jgi:hypothetical protein